MSVSLNSRPLHGHVSALTKRGRPFSVLAGHSNCLLLCNVLLQKKLMWKWGKEYEERERERKKPHRTWQRRLPCNLKAGNLRHTERERDR